MTAAVADDASTATDENRVDGRIRIELTDEEMDDVEQIARARNQSYVEGKTADTNYSDDDGLEKHAQGFMAEMALALLYEEAEVDRTISETGDDGVDCEFEIGGELVEVDVKASSYEDAWLMVKQGYDHEEAEAFVSAYVDEDAGVVELVGFEWAEELLVEENLEPSPSPYYDHMNYEMRSGFRPMPEPNSERGDWQ
jgi:hypothetical protein